MTKHKIINYKTFGLFLIIGIHIFILSRLIFFPYPELFIYSYLTDQGLLPYKQIFDQHFPGLMFFPINLHSLGMTTPEIARVWHFGVMIATHLALFFVAKRLFRSERWALFTNFLYLIWQPFFEGYVLWIDTFVPLLLLPCFYFFRDWLEKKSTRKLFLSGLFLGLTLLFKQVTALLIVLLSFLILLGTKKVRSIWPFALGISIPLAILFIYVLSIGVWKDFFYWTVTFNLTTFAKMGRKYPDIVGIFSSLPVFGLTFLVWLTFFRKTRSRDLLLLGVFFIGSLFYAFARFDFVHLQPALPFALLILVYAFVLVPKRYLQAVYLGFVALSFVFLVPFYKTHIGKQTLFFGELERKVSAKVRELTETQEKVFAFGTMPHLYQMTSTLPSGNVFVFQFPWFMTVAEEKVLTGIINDPPKVVVRDKTATTGGLRLVSYMENIDNYLGENYQVADIIDGVEIMIPK